MNSEYNIESAENDRVLNLIESAVKDMVETYYGFHSRKA